MEFEAVYNVPQFKNGLKVLGAGGARKKKGLGALAVFLEGSKKCSKMAATIRSDSGVWVEIPKRAKAKRLKIRLKAEFETSDFSELFYFCKDLSKILRLDIGGKGTAFNGMFEGCLNLASVPAFNTGNGTDFNAMFKDCKSLESVPLLDTGNGENFSWMFEGCLNLAGVPAFNTHNGTDFNAMFKGCKSLASVPLLDTGNGENFSRMFEDGPSVPEWAKGLLNVA